MTTAPPTTTARARAVTGVARSISGVAVTLGLLGVLNTGLDDLGSDSAETLFVFLVHPVTALVWLVMGLVGIAMATRPTSARHFLMVIGPLLIAWALLALVAGDGVTQVLTRDPELVALLLAGGLLAAGAAYAPLPPALVRLLERGPEDTPGGAPTGSA